mmetsp:Transcript_8608/g.13645  ORF Transcript_8608/g.13645 Transcript_8608/m.13645 type:complete len:249 (+) Transcript_8608:435-1181(+)
MPLHLARPCVEHRRREDGQHHRSVTKNAVLDDGAVLLHSDRERHIVVLRPTAQRRQPQDWPLEALLLEFLRSVLHQQRVPVVHRIAQLESEDCIGAQLLKLRTQLQRCQAVLIHAIVVNDGPQHLDSPTYEPVTGRHDHVDVRVTSGCDAECAGCPFFFAMLVHLGAEEQSDDLPVWPLQGDPFLARDSGFVLGGAGLHDRHRHGHPLPTDKNVLVVKTLQILVLSHEALQGAGPALCKGMDPLQLLL